MWPIEDFIKCRKYVHHSCNHTAEKEMRKTEDKHFHTVHSSHVRDNRDTHSDAAQKAKSF